MVQNAVQHQIPVKLGKETATVTVNAQEILNVELIIVYLSLGIACQTLIAVKRVRHCYCRQQFIPNFLNNFILSRMASF